MDMEGLRVILGVFIYIFALCTCLGYLMWIWQMRGRDKHLLYLEDIPPYRRPLVVGLYVTVATYIVLLTLVHRFLLPNLTEYSVTFWELLVPLAAAICVSYYTERGMRHRLLESWELEHPNWREEELPSRRQSRREIPLKVRHEVFRRAKNRCQQCGKSAADGVKLEVDHIMPVSRGGSDDISNLQLLCFDCNRGKSDRVD